MRELFVPHEGRLQRTDTIHAADLPVPEGRHGEFVNGQLIPVAPAG